MKKENENEMNKIDINEKKIIYDKILCDIRLKKINKRDCEIKKSFSIIINLNKKRLFVIILISEKQKNID